MPRKKHSSFTFEPLERRVEVRLQQSNLKSGDEEAAVYYGQVLQQRFTIGNAIAELAENHSNLLSKETILYVVSQLNQLLLKKLSQGYALDVLDLGTLRMVVAGSIDAASPKSEIAQKLALSFTPSPAARNALRGIKVGTVRKAASAHCIYGVQPMVPPLVQGEPKVELGAGDCPVIFSNNLARITGKALRVGEGQEQGIYLEPEKGGSEGRLKAALVVTNKPSALLFMVPPVDAGRYQIVVVTNVSASGNRLKSAVEISFGPVEVRSKEEDA